jgi:hypothetical protein
MMFFIYFYIYYSIHILPLFPFTAPLVYIPLLKPVGSVDYHRVIRIPSQEAFPIPTYGRVLYYLLLEVVDKETHEPEKPVWLFPLHLNIVSIYECECEWEDD